ncbi:hypothetical protein TrCOL_g3648 [Triparma columacea]|uniref:Uncharacterized protein n=1 Tax=Triparma columacea TaxID=722753 RepID=A0A9W7GP02_9STRA|nr:hypothetical protein TrCOL_g3648 [Triparma columacea]
MSRSYDYARPREADSLEYLGEKLKMDLRRNIRCIGNFPVLSDRWCDMADTLGRVATVSEAEAKLPKESEGATLWETEEAALRYVLEDGKLNLCLRNMVDFKQFEREQYKMGNSGIRTEHMSKMDKFEKGLGVVLKNAWSHVEAIQTTDLPLLIDYCSQVVKFGVENKEFVSTKVEDNSLCERQEVVVMHYIMDLMNRVDDIGEDRLMPLMKEKKLFSLMLRFINTWSTDMMEEHLIVGLTALALIIETEDFKTFKGEHIDEDDRDILVGLDDEEWLEDICDDDKIRRKVRPVLDVIRESKRMRK